MRAKIVAKEGEELPPVEIMAKAILDISESMKTLANSRLSRRAVIALIHDGTGLPKNKITLVLDSLESLERDWLKPKPMVKKQFT